MDLEQTIDALVYRKKKLDLDNQTTNKQQTTNKADPLSRQRPKGGRGVGYAFDKNQLLAQIRAKPKT
jgi:hypothetical protein